MATQNPGAGKITRHPDSVYHRLRAPARDERAVQAANRPPGYCSHRSQ
ncbi:hypothetical protein BRYFOR_05542 [Marvinbryantia formatexigens DSM 14469]|uniref:Uncharacterized protein n=1 Tax=Marvinbryantia formatexigens DSM 14469 TaxID=478749 RepID=C6LAA0_9FIRM|nr:hypothetical protein BRYFOR_05542 [Marvinbryantia formatexigens DSM 14469]